LCLLLEQVLVIVVLNFISCSYFNLLVVVKTGTSRPNPMLPPVDRSWMSGTSTTLFESPLTTVFQPARTEPTPVVQLLGTTPGHAFPSLTTVGPPNKAVTPGGKMATTMKKPKIIFIVVSTFFSLNSFSELFLNC
jgi:hypothetical protein